MPTMRRLPAVFFLLLSAEAAATWGSFFPVADGTQLEPADGASGSCIGRKRDALLAFKQGIDEDYNDYLESWQPGRQDCCRWKGVTCDNATGHVIQLDLSHTSLVGQMSSSLLSLEHLGYLSLTWTSLCTLGGRLEFLGSFKSLRHLDLYYYSCSSAPLQIGNLTNLEYFELMHTYVDNGGWVSSYETSDGKINC